MNLKQAVKHLMAAGAAVLLLSNAPCVQAATFTVTKTADTNDGACNTDCSLREAITAANADAVADSIAFAAGVTGQIDLATALPILSTNLSITGPGSGLLTVRRNVTTQFRIFTVAGASGTSSGPTVALSKLTISNGSVGPGTSNSEEFFGGGLFNRNGNVTLSEIVFSGNSARHGGGIWNGSYVSPGAVMNVTNCTFSGNTSNSGGGGGAYNVALLTANGCTFSNNSSSYGGGFNSDTTANLSNCTFSANTSLQDGGAVYSNLPSAGDAVALLNCTIYNNSAVRGGGYYSHVGATRLGNCIVVGNSGGDLAVSSSGAFTSNDYNLVGTGAISNFSLAHDVRGATTTQLKLGPLQDNGGPTFTHALLESSLAIDAGNTSLTIDQRGAARPQGGADDIGAYEASPSYQISDAVITEGDSATTNLTFTVTLPEPAPSDVVITYSTADGTATAGSDYVAVSNGTLTIPTGQSSGVINIAVIGDTIFEADETFAVNITSVTAPYVVGHAEAIGTIVNDDQGPPVALNQNQILQPNQSVTLALGATDPNSGDSLTFSLVSLPSHGTLSINGVPAATGPFSGNQVLYTPQSDYTGADSFTFTATDDHGNVSNIATVRLNVILTDFIVNSAADTDDGTCDTASCTLREAISAANAAPDANTIGFSLPDGENAIKSATLSITSSVEIIGPATGLTVGGGGGRVFSLSGASSMVVLRNLTLAGGTGNSTFSLPGAIYLVAATLTMRNCTITNNQGAPGANARFPLGHFVPASRGGSGGIYVINGNLTLINCTVTGNSGGKGGDNPATGTRSSPGATGGVGGIEVIGVSTVNLINTTVANNSGGTGGAGSGQGDGGTGGIFNSSTLSLSNSLVARNIGGVGATVGVPDLQGSATSNGYNLLGSNMGSTGLTNGVNHDLVGNVAAPLDPKLGPLQNNGGPTFTMALLMDSPAINAGNTDLTTDQRGVSRPQGNADDIGAYEVAEATISINDISVKENNSGVTNAVFTVTLLTASTQTVTVKYATAGAPSGAGTATAPADYTSTSGTLTFAPRETRKTISVPVKGDVLDEADEIFRVNLSNATNAPIGKAQGIGTIIDDDVAPSVSINDVIVTEGDSSTKLAIFTVTLSTASGQTVFVNAIPTNGTAKAPADYTSGGQTITFAPGETRKTFNVPVVGDTLDEDTETFYVLLSSPVNAAIAKGRGICMIIDNDAAPTITIEDVRIGEGNLAQGAPSQRTAVFRLHLSAPSGKLVKVSYATAAGTANPATADEDYVAVTPTQIAFTTGQTVALARVLINGDTLNELDETFKVNLSGVLNARISDAQAIGTILNDDPTPALSINDVSITEGNPPSGGAPGTKNLTFTVSLSAPSSQAISVNYATADGIARSTSDYATTNGSLVFAAGTTTRTINVVINGDTQVEGDETLFVLLTGATNANVSKARGVGTINNDDGSG